jgi:hypothetical protein
MSDFGMRSEAQIERNEEEKQRPRKSLNTEGAEVTKKAWKY